MNPTDLYTQLHALTTEHLKHYRDDLEKLDKKTLEEWPDIRFLHYTRENGTHLILMPEAEDPCWPAHGQVVPYLFGEASRAHILDQKMVMGKYMRDHSLVRQIVFFNGRALEAELDHNKALYILQTYITRVGTAWNAQRKAA